MTLKITIRNQDFVLHPSGSIFWPDQQMLLIADVHLGKVVHFRKAGFAVPPEAIARNFEQLDEAVAFFRPKTICFLGDLFHSEINAEWNLFAEWNIHTPAKVILVAGNHDIIAPIKYAELDIPIFREIAMGDFLLTHHPTEREGFFNFSGHIHPAVRLKGKGRQYMTLPCFFHKPLQMILPAFGHFTGKFELVPKEGDCVYAVTKEEVIVVCD